MDIVECSVSAKRSGALRVRLEQRVACGALRVQLERRVACGEGMGFS